MNRLSKLALLTIWSIVGLMYPVRAHAQYPTGYELLCPTNTVLASIANATGYDPSTSLNRAIWCVNPSNGDTYYNDQVTNGGTGAVTAVTGTSPIVSSGGTTPAISCPTCALTSGVVTSLFGATGAIVDGTTLTQTVGFVDPSGATIGLGANATLGGFQIQDSNSAVSINSDEVSGQLLFTWATSSTMTFTATGITFSGAGTALTNPGIVGANLSGTLAGSPNFSGSPTAITQTAGNNTTRLATTAFVATSFAPLASPALTGTPTAPTASAVTNNTTIATTAFVATSFAAPPAIGNTTPAQGSFTVLKGNTLNTTTNCASGISPAGCGTAASGSVALPTGTNPTLVVNSSAVTANSVIELTVDESLGTKLGVTCNTTLSTLLNPVVTARTAGTSFTFTIGAIIASNPACVNYVIFN